MADGKMSLDALLEAAQYIERSNHTDAKARGRTAHGETTVSSETVTSTPAVSDIQSSPVAANVTVSREENEKQKKAETDEDDSAAKGHWRRPGGAGMRETHNKLEKNRRAHLKECFDNLRQQIPNLEDKKTSNLNILRQSIRYIQFQRRREKELEQELQRLAQAKILLQLKFVSLETDLNNMQIDISSFLKSSEDGDNHSVSTATADESPIMSDEEEEPSFPLKIIAEEDTLSSSETFQTTQLAAEPLAAEAGSLLPTTITDVKIITDKSAMSKVILPVTIQDNRTPVLAKALSQAAVPRTVLNASPRITVATLPASSPVPIQMAPPPAKPLVARILHHAITERQNRLQKQQRVVLQQQQQQQDQQVIVQSPKQNEQVIQIPQQQIASIMAQPQVLAVNTGNVRAISTTTVRNNTVTPLRPTVSFSHLLPSVVPAASLIAQAPPVLNTTSTASPALTTTLPVNHQTPLIRVALPTSKTGSSLMTTIPLASTVVTSAVSTSSVAIAPIPVSTTTSSVTVSSPAVNINNMKHVINTPITALPAAQIVAPAAQISALQQILAQSASRQSVVTTATANPITMTPVISVPQAQILSSSTPSGQLVSQMAVLSPAAVQVPLATALTQAQIIKTHVGNIPILSQYTVPIKPVVMVTVPSVVAGANSVTVASAGQPSVVTVSNAL